MHNNYSNLDKSKVYVRRKEFVLGYIALILVTIVTLSLPLFIAAIALFLFLHPSTRVYYLDQGRKKRIIVSKNDWVKYRKKNHISIISQFFYSSVAQKIQLKEKDSNHIRIVEDKNSNETDAQEIKPTRRPTENRESIHFEQDLLNPEDSISILDTNKSDTIKVQNNIPDNKKVRAPEKIKTLQYRKDKVHKPKNIKPLPTLNLDDSEDSFNDTLPNFSYSDKAEQSTTNYYQFKIDPNIQELITSVGNLKFDQLQSAIPFFGPKKAGLCINIKGKPNPIAVSLVTCNSNKFESIYKKVRDKLKAINQIIEQNEELSLSREQKDIYLKLKQKDLLVNFGNADFGIDSSNQSIFVDQLYSGHGFKLIKLSKINQIDIDNKIGEVDNASELKFKVVFNNDKVAFLNLNKYTTPGFNLASEQKLQIKIYQEFKKISNLKEDK